VKHVARNPELPRNIAANVTRILESRGLSVADLVESTGEPPNTIYRLCRGDNVPLADLVDVVARSLDVSVERLFQKPAKVPAGKPAQKKSSPAA
jgi:transcriptional regulator with XRE-family HTH domain